MDSARGSRTTYMILLAVVLVALAAFLLTRKPAVSSVPAEPGQWKKNFEAAQSLNMRNLSSEAEALLAGTLEQARSEGRSTPELAEYLIRYSASIYKQRKYDDTIAPAKEAEALIDSLPPDRKPPDLFIFNNYGNMAGSYYFSRNFEQSEPYIEKAMAIANKPQADIPLSQRQWILEISKNNAEGLERQGLKPKNANQ